MKFTFKTTKPTGRFRSFFSKNHHIKFNKIEVGEIGDEKPHKIRLKVLKADLNEDGNPNCDWKWITLTKQSESVDAAKEWLNTNAQAIAEKFKLKVS